MLSALKDDPNFGGRSLVVRAEQKAKIMAAIGHDVNAAPVPYTIFDYLTYYRATMMPVAIRSFGAVAAVFAIFIGGWMTTVNAASKSLPGDALYGFKIITEQVQLRLASLEERAVLHTEFAANRLEEAVTLQKNGSPSGDSNVQDAFDAFTREVASASTDLQTLKENGSADAVATAGQVEQKLATLDTVLDESVAAAPDAFATVAVQEAQDASRETQTTAVAVVVDTHEETESAQTANALREMFMRELGTLTARQTFDLHRIAVLRNAIHANDERLAAAMLPTSAELGILERDIKTAAVHISDATTLYNVNDYRGAFATLRSVDGDLQQTETRMAQAEIAITQSFTPPAVVTSPSAPDLE